MDISRLTRQSHRRTRPGLRLLDRFELAGLRAHEACGTARRRFALWLAQACTDPIIWIRPDWHPDRLHMAGARADVDPGRVVLVNCCRPADLLWCAEEGLRSGLLPLVVVDLPEPPGLTPVRRLHLAAETGSERTGRAPLCLLLTPGDGGAAGVESRWRLSPAHQSDTPTWSLSRLRARDAPPAEWSVVRGTDGRPTVKQTDPTPQIEPA
ncbi:ImuA family protein [Hasllibacter sp. MH4015]|uniref:ImuA family protein n=1 Tax=Hasllibacter sp. MH4015 TaxID=2854029 RepID=UPI001CD40465|nr:hypothetical protein [Hasllibacter sp. MH4015]